MNVGFDHFKQRYKFLLSHSQALIITIIDFLQQFFCCLTGLINMLLFKILVFILTQSYVSPLFIPPVWVTSSNAVFALEGLSRIRAFKEWRSWHQSDTSPHPQQQMKYFKGGHLPPPLRFYGVPTHVDSLKWAWQLKNIKSVCVFKNNLWLGIKKWLLNKNRIFFLQVCAFFFSPFFWRPHTCKIF